MRAARCPRYAMDSQNATPTMKRRHATKMETASKPRCAWVESAWGTFEGVTPTRSAAPVSAAKWVAASLAPESAPPMRTAERDEAAFSVSASSGSATVSRMNSAPRASGVRFFAAPKEVGNVGTTRNVMKGRGASSVGVPRDRGSASRTRTAASMPIASGGYVWPWSGNAWATTSAGRMSDAFSECALRGRSTASRTRIARTDPAAILDTARRERRPIARMISTVRRVPIATSPDAPPACGSVIRTAVAGRAVGAKVFDVWRVRETVISIGTAAAR